MSVETSAKILKVFGIIDIVLGILAVLLGILATAGGGMLAAVDSEQAVTGGMAIIAGVILVVSGIVSLLQGIFSVRASKDFSKIMPAWIFAIIGLIVQAISFITNLSKGAGSVGSAILSIAISVLIFVAANTIKKENA